jgi:lipopolysaccharide/colanic/teichoic acid biosynthesis glycosyltransferase
MALHQGKSTQSRITVIPTQRLTRQAKRIIDIVSAAGGLLLLSPLIGIVAVAIKLYSRGPIFCRETLYGYARQQIQAFRFRTWTGSRVSRIGIILHQTGIVELPRLLNVLRGELSIVGPCVFTNRQDFMNGNVTSLLAEFNPGLTGRAQLIEVRKGSLTAEQRIFEDLHYVENWSILLDLKIILMTLFSQKATSPDQRDHNRL